MEPPLHDPALSAWITLPNAAPLSFCSFQQIVLGTCSSARCSWIVCSARSCLFPCPPAPRTEQHAQRCKRGPSEHSRCNASKHTAKAKLAQKALCSGNSGTSELCHRSRALLGHVWPNFPEEFRHAQGHSVQDDPRRRSRKLAERAPRGGTAGHGRSGAHTGGLPWLHLLLYILKARRSDPQGPGERLYRAAERSNRHQSHHVEHRSHIG